MDPSDVRKLKRVAAKTSMAEGPSGMLKKIHLVSHPCPLVGTAPRAEGVVLAMALEPPPAYRSSGMLTSTGSQDWSILIYPPT